MTTYIALLRGINVGGKNIIKMAELQRLFENLGLLKVQTYIQSGNVLFKAAEKEEPLRDKIESRMTEAFGFPVTVILRTSEEMEVIMMNCPFSQEDISDAESSSGVESLYVSLLADIPSIEKIQYLNGYKSDQESFKVVGRDIYLLFRNSIRNSKLANKLQKLDTPSTVRNWKTISKLYALAKEMEKQAY